MPEFVGGKSNLVTVDVGEIIFKKGVLKMGFRMYCNTYPKSIRDVSDVEESPKFFGYVKEPPSYKFLHELYLDNKISIIEEDEDFDDGGWVLESYDNMCSAPYTSKFILSSEDFKIFITKFMSDLLNNNYEIRDEFSKYIDELINTDSKKIIQWG